MSRALVLGVWVVAGLAGAAEAPLPPTAEVMKELRRIEAATLRGSADELRIKYSAGLREAPNDPLLRVYAAWLSLPSDDAWNQLKAITPIYPDNPWPHYGMARIYVKWKMREQAAAEVAAATKKDPGFYPALLVKGDLAAASEQWAEAEGFYRQALKAADDPLAHTGLGLALLKQGKKDEALAELKGSIKAFPEQPAALALVVPLLIEGKDPAAVDAAQAAADLRPKDREARRAVAELRLEAGDKAGAAKDYEKLLVLGQPDAATLRKVAGVFRELGQGEKEERVLANLVALEATETDALVRLADLRAEKKDVAGADEKLTLAVSRDPKRLDALLRLAQSKLDQGELNQALERFRQARAADPTNEPAKAAVEKLEGDFHLKKFPLKGNVNGIYWAVSSTLDKFYAERRAAKPALAGKLRLRVHLTTAGTAELVEVVEDTLKDPLLLGHVYFTLRDAEYSEKKKLEPVIDFELGQKKGK